MKTATLYYFCGAVVMFLAANILAKPVEEMYLHEKIYVIAIATVLVCHNLFSNSPPVELYAIWREYS